MPDALTLIAAMRAQEPVAWTPTLTYPKWEEHRVWGNGKPSEADCKYWEGGITLAYTRDPATLDALQAEVERLSAGHATALVALAEARAEVERLTRELDAQRVYARVLCRAVDAATDFAGTVAGGASWWDDVWSEHKSALDAARSAISDAARTTGSSNA